ncbi:unnamed protein product [marine sediment metagenome]|uniref:Uncharacterized protein n=1 Tax=marine sediment metagenome TaxID=412755 RepID=X1SRD6_9ZZZZ
MVQVYVSINLPPKFSLDKLINSNKIKFSNLSHDYESTTREAFEELRVKRGIVRCGNYFFYGKINVTVSDYCFYSLKGKCPPQSENGWKKCHYGNIPCEKFNYN